MTLPSCPIGPRGDDTRLAARAAAAASPSSALAHVADRHTSVVTEVGPKDGRKYAVVVDDDALLGVTAGRPSTLTDPFVDGLLRTISLVKVCVCVCVCVRARARVCVGGAHRPCSSSHPLCHQFPHATVNQHPVLD